jgi:hypothetical protein
MASTYTTRIGLEKQGDGENANTWGLKLNSNVIDLVDEAVAGYETIDLSSGAVSLTDTNGVPNQARNFGLKFTGALTADTTVTIPAKEKIYYIFNDTTENYTIYIKPAGGTAVSVVEAGRSMIAATDGSNINLLESVDPNVYATKVEVQAVSATMATSINNSNVARASLSATMATSINNSNVARAALSATVATSINNSNIAIAANTSNIAVVSSTMATSISNTNSRIAATSLTLATSISNSNTAIATVSSTLESRIATVSANLKSGAFVVNNAVNATNATNASNAGALDGLDSTFFTNAANITTGILAAARLSGNYNINNTGTLDGYNGSDFLRVTASSLSQNGYIKFSNNLIIQWGRTYLPSSGGTITWPIAFSSVCYTAIGNDSTNVNGSANMVGSISRFNWTGDVNATATYNWIAIGF